MATEHNFKRFFREFEQEFKDKKKDILDDLVGIALQTYTDIMTMSPVDTGLFRHSNILTIDTMSDEVPGTPQGAAPQGQVDLARLEEAKALLEGINPLKFKTGFEIWITNNLEYATAILHGHSLQAPNNIYAAALVVAEKRLKELAA